MLTDKLFARAHDLGIQSPPCSIHFLPIPLAREGWGVLVRTQPMMAEAAREWLDAIGARIELAPLGSSEHVLWAVFPRLPAQWDRALSGLEIVRMRLDPDGAVHMIAEGPPVAFERYATRRSNGADRTTRKPSITPRQAAALEVAMQNGYYEVPRRASQRDIASMLGISGATCSELLRRAEFVAVAEFRKQRSATDHSG